MITYLDKDTNGSDYTVLFDKASTKLGLAPIITKERNPITHEIEETYSKKVYLTNGTWETQECEYRLVTNEEGQQVKEYLEIDENGNLLELKRDEEGHVVFDENNKPIVLRTIYPIGNLNEYFQHIKDLARLAIGQGRSGSDPYFLRLPVDEPFFEINANTRGITVPGELSQIAVVGDKLAEIVFFRIDRYYDAVDLNTRHIYIEWELPDGTKGISRDFLRDTQSEKDKIIFGWAIGEELTKQVGTIRFAVRFVEWFDNKTFNEENRLVEQDVANTGTQLLYSFSSLPATISVVDSLHYSLFEDDEAFSIISKDTEDNVGTIVLYLEDSDPDSADASTAEPADLPVFVRDLSNAFYVNAEAIPEKSNYYKINLGNDGKLELRVEAAVTDGGNISYVFGRIAHTADEGTGIKATGATGIIAQIKFIQAENVFGTTPLAEITASSEFNTNKTFYVENSAGAYSVVSENDARAIIADALTKEEDPNTKFFEKVAYIEVAQPGHYYAIADNQAGGKKVNSNYSSRFYIPWASKPVINQALANKFIFNERTYSIAADESDDMKESALKPTQTNVRVTSELVENASNIANLKVTATADALTYKWYRNADIHKAFNVDQYHRPDGLTDEEWATQESALMSADGWVLIDGANTNTYEATDSGFYAVKIINDFNNSTVESDLLDAGLCRVTPMPDVPTVDWDAFAGIVESGRIPNSLTVSIGDLKYDKVSYQWHMITFPTAGSDELNKDLENATDAMIEAPAGELTFNEQGKALVPFVPRTTGTFYLELRNELNGVEAIYNSGQDTNAININVTTL